MSNSLLRLKTYWQLGLKNVVAVAYYRTQIKTGYFQFKMPISKFGFLDSARTWVGEPTQESSSNDPIFVEYFNARKIAVDSPPNWFYDPYTAQELSGNDVHWSKLPDFSLNTGDVKVLWEQSRFEWLIQACWKLRNGESTSVLPIRVWLRSWFESNPANQGVNWKCAQEASIRGMHTVFASLMLNEESLQGTYALEEILIEHINRIMPTVSYAKAQDNNHGTSEAVALFTMGAVLGSFETSQQNSSAKTLAKKAEAVGHKLLENRVDRLISEDGTFSQYSVVYHRMMLDTLSFAECIRRRYRRPMFTTRFYKRSSAATHWLLSMVDAESGDAPNIGANDGAFLFNASGNTFREFRPSCQLAASLFGDKPMYQQHEHSLAIVFSKEIETGTSNPENFRPNELNTGFKVAGAQPTYAVLKTPDNRFRPSQADALHLDVWHKGVNLVRDAGTYSYNASDDIGELGSTNYHSTIEFDGKNQMPKISRFLYANWLSETVVADQYEDSDVGRHCMASGYVNHNGNQHQRHVSVESKTIRVDDQVSGKFSRAVLRWRLCPADWTLVDKKLRSDIAVIEIIGNNDISVKLTESKESRYYLEVQSLPVLEIELTSESAISTIINIT